MNTEMNTNEYKNYGRGNFHGRGGFRGRGRGRGNFPRRGGSRGYGSFRPRQNEIDKYHNQLNFYDEMASVASIIQEKPIKVDRDDSKNYPNEFIGIVEIAKINKIRAKKGMKPLTDEYYKSKGIMTHSYGELIYHTNNSFFRTMSSMNIIIRQDTSSGRVKIMANSDYLEVISLKKKPIQEGLAKKRAEMKADETSSSSSSDEEDEDEDEDDAPKKAAVAKKAAAPKKADSSSSDEEEETLQEAVEAGVDDLLDSDED